MSKITIKDIENSLTSIVKESINKINNGIGTTHDKWVIENIKLNSFINHLKFVVKCQSMMKTKI